MPSHNYGVREAGGTSIIYHKGTQESLIPYSPIPFHDDFLAKSINTNVWATLDTSAVGNTTPVLVANAAGGVISLPLDATNEVQLTGLYWGDQSTLTLNRGIQFEAVVALSVLPTGAVTFCCGLMDVHNASADSVGTSIWFRADGSGAITVETDDGTNESTQVATGITLLANVFHTFRIDCTDPAKVLFFIDGNQVPNSSAFNVSAVPTVQLQPVVRLSKAAAASLGTAQVDSIRCWQARAALP